MEKLYVGSITIVVDTPHYKPPLTKAEEVVIARSVAEEFQVKLKRKAYPFEVELELLSTDSGCTKLKYGVYLLAAGMALGSAFDYISKYKDFRESIPLLLEDGGYLYKCYVRQEEASCKAFLHSNQLSEHLYLVVNGDTLSEIVLIKWKVHPHKARQMMNAVVRHNPQAFVGGDMNKLLAGSTLAVPTQEMLKGVPGGKL